jgi:hypothetical protein
MSPPRALGLLGVARHERACMRVWIHAHTSALHKMYAETCLFPPPLGSKAILFLRLLCVPVFIPLTSPRLCSPEHMSLVHHSRQTASVNVVSLPVHRGLHTHATPSSYQRLAPASRHSVASSTRQKRSFFGVGEILHVIVNVRMSFRLASIARPMPG